VKTLAAVLSLAAITSVPASAAVTRGFFFGRTGGNIRPLEVRISASGRVVVDKERRGVLTQARLRALEHVVEQQRFTALPVRIVCKGVLPDIATRHVTASGKSVTAQGGCSVRFDHVYSALARAAGVT
jgi:hypothetical protein